MKNRAILMAATLAMSSMLPAADFCDRRETLFMPVPDSGKTRGGKKEHSNRHTGARKIQRAAKKKRSKR